MKSHLLKAFSILTCCFILIAFTQTTFALEPKGTVVSVDRIEYADGSYAIVETEEISAGAVTRATYTKTGSKTFTYYNSSDDKIFAVKVTGGFSYTGSSSWATSSAATVYIYDDSASYISKSATYYDNTASATGTVKYNYVNIPRTVTLTCDKNGNLS